MTAAEDGFTPLPFSTHAKVGELERLSSEKRKIG
jgi:hypothetical protein